MNRHSQVGSYSTYISRKKSSITDGFALGMVALIDHLAFEMLDVGQEFEFAGLLRDEIEPLFRGRSDQLDVAGADLDRFGLGFAAHRFAMGRDRQMGTAAIQTGLPQDNFDFLPLGLLQLPRHFQFGGQINGRLRPDAHRIHWHAQLLNRRGGGAGRGRAVVVAEVAEHHQPGEIAGGMALGQVVERRADRGDLALGGQLRGKSLGDRAGLRPLRRSARDSIVARRRGDRA